MNNRPTVALGLLGSVLDRGDGARRWEHWRPTVSLFQHADLRIDRFELIVEPKFRPLAETVAADIRSVSPETDVNLREIAFEDPWDFEEVFGKLHTFARSYPFEPDEEDYLVHITTGSHVQQICLFLLTESRHFPARLVQTAPPKRKESSGPGRYAVIDLDLSRYDKLVTRFEDEAAEALTFLKSGIATRNKSFNKLIEQIESVAIHSRAPMLLMGPTGAGKSQLARRIHELKKARHQLKGAFVEVNCATIRGDAASSALFGHVKGAFTGAAVNRKGHLLAANGGVLFLDEIGELGPDEQAMLLRAIEEKRFFPVGADSEVVSDFQLIAGTNRDLHNAVRAGKFRDDLLARINLWTFKLPALRERVEDIEPNLDYELDQFTRQTGAHVTFNKEARERFLEFATSPAAQWTGNFRDLNAAVCRMATLAESKRIGVDAVDEEIKRLRSTWGASPSGSDVPEQLPKLIGPDRLAQLDLFDRAQLEFVIRVCRESGSLSDAGRKLYAVTREKRKDNNDADRLRKYLLKFGLSWQVIR
ncbi:AAA domain-containing protein [bacterium]|nr:AAA domain-containing protein [bacterium]